MEVGVERQAVSLDGAWDFHFCGDAEIALEDIDHWRQCVKYPRPGRRTSELRQRNGRAWYRRTFEFLAEWLSETVYFRCGAVSHYARVLVNRTVVTEHEGGWLPFEVEIGASLRPGVNEVAVHVAAPTDDPAGYPEYPFAETLAGKQSWYGPLGGIWQSVLLERRASDHLRLLSVRPRREDGSVELTLVLHAGCRSARARDPDRARRPDGRGCQPTPGRDSGAGDDIHRRSRAAGLVARCSPPYKLCGSPAERQGRRPDPGALRVPLDRDPRRADLSERSTLFLRGALDQDYYPDSICTPPRRLFSRTSSARPRRSD